MTPAEPLPEVTVCIPAYRAGGFVAQTLASVQRQRHRRLRILVGVEPPVAETLPAIEPFLDDPRVTVIENPVRLGWDANIATLLHRVETPNFVILPHDDVLHPGYVEALLADVSSQPDAVVSYADMLMFGLGRPVAKTMALPRDGSLVDRVLPFLLQGAEAVPWRGVTSSTVLQDGYGFPTDGRSGYAVECEWAFRLLIQGRALRIPRPLYFKRLWGPVRLSASQARIVDHSTGEVLAAWQAHRARMQALVHEALDGRQVSERTRLVVDAALHAAMLRRHRLTLPIPPAPEDLAATADFLARLSSDPSPAARSAVATLMPHP